jgi:hypothetical protein
MEREREDLEWRADVPVIDESSSPRFANRRSRLQVDVPNAAIHERLLDHSHTLMIIKRRALSLATERKADLLGLRTSVS